MGRKYDDKDELPLLQQVPRSFYRNRFRVVGASFFVALLLLSISGPDLGTDGKPLRTHEQTQDEPYYQVLPTVKMLKGGIGNLGVPYFETLTPRPDSRVIIDIGANVGTEALAAVKSGYIVYAFEPMADNFGQMVAEFEKQKLSYAIVNNTKKAKEWAHFSKTYTKREGFAILFPFACSNETGVITMRGAGMMASAVQAFWTNNVVSTANVVRVDDMVQEDRIYMFKTDIQGLDFFAFVGAEKLFRNSYIEMVLFELWPRNQIMKNVTSQMFFDLVQKDYSFYPCFDVSNKDAPLVRDPSTESYAKWADTHSNQVWVGWFDDILCMNAQRPPKKD